MTRFLLAVIAVETLLLWQLTAEADTLARDLHFAQTAGQVVCAPEPAIEYLDEVFTGQTITPTEVAH